MYDFEAEYRRIFETPLDEIKEDVFFRADNFQNEKWYGDLTMYQSLGICQPNKESISNLQKALKVLGYPTQAREMNGKFYLMPQTLIC